MQTSRLHRPAALLAAAAVVLAGCSSTDGTGSELPAVEPLGVDAGEGPLPEASFARIDDPDTIVSTTEWVGTPTVINFWATWCGFCLEEMPALQAASEALEGSVRFVGIDRQDQRDPALAFLADTGVTYLNLSSPDGAYFEELRARGMPTTLFVDAEGQVAFRHTGPLDLEGVLALVEEHLGVAA